MQKFKVSRNILKELTGDAFHRVEHIYSVLPDFIELEGELLESGTVKCPHGCDHFSSTVCICPCHKEKECDLCIKYGTEGHACCHNKKEEDRTIVQPLNRNFNRESPKRCPTCGHSKEMGTVARCTSDFHGETPKDQASYTYKGITATVKVDYENQTFDLQMKDAVLKEEVKLPEEIEMTTGTYLNQENLVKKFNELVRYLKAHE